MVALVFAGTARASAVRGPLCSEQISQCYGECNYYQPTCSYCSEELGDEGPPCVDALTCGWACRCIRRWVTFYRFLEGPFGGCLIYCETGLDFAGCDCTIITEPERGEGQ